MNRTKIEWADWTWSPVTGCLHDCHYCYARRIAERFGDRHQNGALVEACEPVVAEGPYDERRPYPYGFAPTFRPNRIDEPAKQKKPANIFVCSMADLFGEWVPDEWIQEVFAACERAPQHRYMFLTKDIHAYDDHEVVHKDNFWYGQSWDCKNTGLTYYGEQKINTFLSIEPMLSEVIPIDALDDGWFKWVIVGAETGNRKGKVKPKREWIEKIVFLCDITETPVFMKNSLADIWGEPLIQQYPWEG